MLTGEEDRRRAIGGARPRLLGSNRDGARFLQSGLLGGAAVALVMAAPVPAPPSQAPQPHRRAGLIARTARRLDYCPAVAVEPPQSPADDLPPQSTLLDSHVKGTHELIAEIEQALDGLLEIAERILWVVEEARYAISDYERALRIGDDIRRQARRNVEEHVRIDAAQRVGQHLGSVGVLNAIRDVLACGARVIDGLVRQNSRKVK